MFYDTYNKPSSSLIRSIRIAMFALVAIAMSFNRAKAQSQLNADEVLQRVSDKLSSLKSIRFHYRQEYDYPSSEYKSESLANCYFDFNSKEHQLGMKFQLTTKNSFFAYNGSEIFELKHLDRTIALERQPRVTSLCSNPYLQYSLLMLRNVLPEINDERQEDSISIDRRSKGLYAH